MLQSVGLQRVELDLGTEQQTTKIGVTECNPNKGIWLQNTMVNSIYSWPIFKLNFKVKVFNV